MMFYISTWFRALHRLTYQLRSERGALKHMYGMLWGGAVYELCIYFSDHQDWWAVYPPYLWKVQNSEYNWTFNIFSFWYHKLFSLDQFDTWYLLPFFAKILKTKIKWETQHLSNEWLSSSFEKMKTAYWSNVLNSRPMFQMYERTFSWPWGFHGYNQFSSFFFFWEEEKGREGDSK